MGQSQARKTRKVEVKSFIIDFRSEMPDHDIMEKHGLTPRAFVQLVKALIARNILVESDLNVRREKAAQRDAAKQSEFLSGLFLCPHCGHPSPVPFEVCPACEAPVHDPGEDESPEASMTSHGKHIVVASGNDDEDDLYLDDDEEEDDEATTKVLEQLETSEIASSTSIRSLFTRKNSGK